MSLLILGIVIFLAIHLLPAIAPNLREQLGERLGHVGWRLIHSGVALVGLYLIVQGYADWRMQPIFVWTPPAFLSHPTALLMVVAFVFLAAAWVPNNAIKKRVGHPMLLAVKTWAVAHLLVNGTLADLLLFGSFLAWGVISFIMHRRADRAAGLSGVGQSSRVATLITVLLGIVMAGLFALWLHPILIGVPAIIRLS